MGFPAETHSVTTEDGYILEMHRIPSNQTQQSSGKLPVIIQHALVCSSAVWVMNSRSQSLGLCKRKQQYIFFVETLLFKIMYN